MTYDYCIIGGGIAGTTAAETIRQHDAKGGIVIVSDEPYRLYSRIALSKPNFFLRKTPFDSVWLKDEAWYAANAITLLANAEATKLDAGEKTISLSNGAVLSYGKLLLAIGGSPQQYDIPGTHAENIFYLRSLDDAKRIIERTKYSKKGIVIGGGFIGFEMCEMLRMAGMDVTVMMRESRFWDPMLDERGSAIIERAMKGRGVTIMPNMNLQSFEIPEGGSLATHAIFKDAFPMPFDIAIVGIGIVCRHAWLTKAGIETQNGICANEYLETNMPDIWTAGDAAQFFDIILQERIQVGNWVSAQMQGRIAGKAMAGIREPYRMVSSYTASAFGIKVAFVGDARPLPNRTIITRSEPEKNSHARLLLNKNVVIGATLINRTQELGSISACIKNRTDVSASHDILSDPTADISKLA